jgi:hypothetical protein
MAECRRSATAGIAKMATEQYEPLISSIALKSIVWVHDLLAPRCFGREQNAGSRCAMPRCE